MVVEILTHMHIAQTVLQQGNRAVADGDACNRFARFEC
jgi:hypothetical protein